MAETVERTTRGQVVTAEGALGSRAVSEYLDRQGWHFQLFAHKPTFRASAEAIASGAQPAFTAKTLVLRTATGPALAVIPASERLDLRKARELLRDKSTRFATEDEISAAFPLVDVGAVPPLGEMLGVPQLLDVQLLQYSRIVASAGDHTHSMVLIPDELLRRGHSRPADLVAE